MKAISLFDDQRLTLVEAIDLSLASLKEYGQRYAHWSVAYSGGKDSSATVTFVTWAIKTGQIPPPQSLTILYADTRQEYPPLFDTAQRLLARLRGEGFRAETVLPALDDRFYVYLLGLGVPPPSNTFRWCTDKLKIRPMTAALEVQRQEIGEKFLLLNGVRLGESAVRDQRIALSCSRKGECGQGWFEVRPPNAVGDSLAPILHWRTCHVFDWLYFENEKHGYEEVLGIADVYGEDDVRTGCIGCNLASRDVALERLTKTEAWSRLAPLLQLKPLFVELKAPRHRHRKAVPETLKDGTLSHSGQRMGPLTMEARAFGLARVLDIQQRAGVDLINVEEEARIRELWAQGAYPQKWSADDIAADVPIDRITIIGDEQVIQPLLVR